MNKLIIVFSVVLLFSLEAFSQSRSGAHHQALQYFPYTIYGSNLQNHNDQMGEIINGDSSPLLDVNGETINYPPFPRTWLELGLSRTEITNTAWIYSVARFDSTIPIIDLKVGASATFATNYRYNVETTFIAISSFRSLNPDAQENSKESFGTIPETQNIPNPLRAIVRWEEDERRTYFNTSERQPIIGICKFEMSLRIAQTESTSLTFLIHEKTDEDQMVSSVTFALYSNPIRVKNDIPIQEYLRTTCDQEFKHLVRYLADDQFNNVVKEVNAHYHPQAQCDWDPKAAKDPRGDASCMNWYRNPRNVMGSYRRNNVPRCVLGREGIPTCVLRAKQNATCPVYLSNNRLVTSKPIDGKGRLLTKGDHYHFPCDVGLSCQSPQKGSFEEIEATWNMRFTGLEARCKKP